jgi:hypothetical protein
MAVGSAKKFFGRVTIFRESGDTRAYGKRRVLRLRRKAFANSGDHARGYILGSFRQDKSEFVAAVAGSRVDRAGMIAQNFPNAHQRAATRQVAEVIVDGLQAVHVQ